MSSRAARFVASLAILCLSAIAGAGAEEGKALPPEKPEAREAPPAKSPAEIRANIYDRLAASKDEDETQGLIRLLFAAYSESGSDTGDLLLERARKAMSAKDFDAAGKILDAAVSILPDWAEGWNARATLRWLDDDYDGSMADIAETLKREPRHVGALSGMAMILAARNRKEDALKVYEHILAIAPHWKSAEDAANKLKTSVKGQEL